MDTCVTDPTDRLLTLALERGALKYGDFALSSGEHSTYYFDGRVLSLDPEGASCVARALLPLVIEVNAQAIGGPTLGADPIVASVALLSYQCGSPISAFIVRDSRKGHGMGHVIEGSLMPGTRVTIVDDVCTTGGAIFRAIEAAEDIGCTVVRVIAVLDRQQGGSKELKRRGYMFTALMEADASGRVRRAEA